VSDNDLTCIGMVPPEPIDIIPNREEGSRHEDPRDKGLIVCGRYALAHPRPTEEDFLRDPGLRDNCIPLIAEDCGDFAGILPDDETDEEVDE
jgi:hypothetical protein